MRQSLSAATYAKRCAVLEILLLEADGFCSTSNSQQCGPAFDLSGAACGSANATKQIAPSESGGRSRSNTPLHGLPYCEMHDNICRLSEESYVTTGVWRTLPPLRDVEL